MKTSHFFNNQEFVFNKKKQDKILNKRILVPVLLFFFIAFTSLVLNGQELELFSSFNATSENRFQNDLGVGMEYNQHIIDKLNIALSVNYNYNKVAFQEVKFFPSMWVIETYAKSRKFSPRLKIQYKLVDNEAYSILAGPMVSYNFFWSDDWIKNYDMNDYDGEYSTHFNKVPVTKLFGYGLSSKVVLKDLIWNRISLSVGMQADVMGKDDDMRYGASVDEPFSGSMKFLEVHLGLSYRFNRDINSLNL